jgi:hypothetical protein
MGYLKQKIMLGQILLPVIIFVSSLACQQETNSTVTSSEPAIVQDIKVSGNENTYTFAVTLKSPDTGCEQYANWWEVISADGNTLIYRRILGHSHVDEQPFSRSGGKVAITANTEVVIRAHMHPTGYGEGIIAMKGTVATGFIATNVGADFGADLEGVSPQSNGCAF